MCSSAAWPSGSRTRWAAGSRGRVHRFQRDAHGVPQAVSCRVLGVSQSWFYKWKAGELPPRAARRERLKAEIARLFAAREGKDGSPRITAALRDARLAGVGEHRGGPDARAGPGRPAQEAAQDDHPAGQGPVAGRTWSSASSRPMASTAAGTATAPRSPPGKASSTWTACWTWAGAGSSGSASAPIITPAWPTGHWPWRWPSAAGPSPAWSCTPIRAASTPRGASGPRASGWASPMMGGPGSALDNAVIESWHSTLESELRSLHQFATRAAAGGEPPGSRITTMSAGTPRSRDAQPGGLRAGAGGKGRRVTAAGPLRGPGKGGGCAAAVLAAPAKGTGPPPRPQGCCASPCGRRPYGPPLTPGTPAAPQSRKSGQATALPRPVTGATRTARPGHDHHNRSLHGLRGTPHGRR